MPRNLDRRVEVITPVEAPEHQERLQEILDVNLADDVLAWELGPDGVWRKVPTIEGSTRSGGCTSWPSIRARRGLDRE